MLDDDDDDDDAKNAISRPSLPAAIETHRVYRLLYRPRLYRQRTIDILSTEAILASNDEKTGHTTKKTFPILPGWQKKVSKLETFSQIPTFVDFYFSKQNGRHLHRTLRPQQFEKFRIKKAEIKSTNYQWQELKINRY